MGAQHLYINNYCTSDNTAESRTKIFHTVRPLNRTRQKSKASAAIGKWKRNPVTFDICRRLFPIHNPDELCRLVGASADVNGRFDLAGAGVR